MRQVPLFCCPLNSNDASEQSGRKRQNEQQPRAKMSCLDSHAHFLSKASTLLDQNVILRYSIMLINE
jgi:hypothetical protein